jgi:hypothetical protein
VEKTKYLRVQCSYSSSNYYSGDKIGKNEVGGACNTYGKEGKPEEKRQLGRTRRKWEDNIEKDLLDGGWGDMDWTDLSQDSNS